MAEKNPQLDLSKEQRTSDIGLFMYAHSYWEAASKLEDADCSSGHAAAPTRFLYSHAIELFLKSYLRSQLLSLNDVKTMSHNLKKAADEAIKHGLQLSHEQLLVLQWITDHNMKNRYIEVGIQSQPCNETFWSLCDFLFDEIGQEMLRSNRTKRLPRRPDFPDTLKLGF